MKKEIIERLYNQLLDKQKQSLYPLFDPDAHTRKKISGGKKQDRYEKTHPKNR